MRQKQPRQDQRGKKKMQDETHEKDRPSKEEVAGELEKHMAEKERGRKRSRSKVRET